MVLVKILKRMDGASLIVAIVLALIVLNLLTPMSGDLSHRLVNGDSFNGGAHWWKNNYLEPIVEAAVGIILLEIVCRLYIWAASAMGKR